MATLGILGFGLAAGPLYPLLILTTPERTEPSGVDRLVAAQSAASGIGAAALPFTLGLAMNISSAMFAPIIALAAAAAGLLHLGMRARRNPSPADLEPPERPTS